MRSALQRVCLVKTDLNHDFNIVRLYLSGNRNRKRVQHFGDSHNSKSKRFVRVCSTSNKISVAFCCISACMMTVTYAKNGEVILRESFKKSVENFWNLNYAV